MIFKLHTIASYTSCMHSMQAGPGVRLYMQELQSFKNCMISMLIKLRATAPPFLPIYVRICIHVHAHYTPTV